MERSEILNSPLVVELINEGGNIAIHPIAKKVYIKSTNKELLNKFKRSFSDYVFVSCDKENTITIGAVHKLSLLISRYKFVFDIHPILAVFYLDEFDEGDIYEFVSEIRKIITRGVVIMENKYIDIFDINREISNYQDRAITKTTITDLIILLNTTKSVDEFIEYMDSIK